ncbi:MAG: hypothetical protein MJY67_00450 [Bacteroidales bacterium]|nr:hypothetical protein [Bacteroidales bacterium]
MKKIFYSIAALALLFAGASCQKALVDQPQTKEGQLVELTVLDNELGETKTAYDATSGITLSGTETIAMFYNNGEKLVGPGADASQPNMATPAGNGVYTFTAPAAAEGCTWYPVMPFNYNIVRLNSTGSAAYVRLSPVQFPGANTFDESMDYLVGKPFQVAADGTATVEGYKRLFSHLRVNVKGLAPSDKIHAATLVFAQAPDAASISSLTGTYYVNLSEDVDQVKLNSVQKESAANAVSAVSLEGIPASGEAWPVWFVVKPTTVSGDLTLTVTTQDAVYTRTVTIAEAKEIAAGKINSISIDVKGAGSAQNEAVIQCFTKNDTAHKLKAGTATLTDCAGNSYSWTAAGSSFGWSNAACKFTAAQLKGGNTFVVPTVADKKIVAVRLFTHYNSAATTSGAVSLELLDGTTSLSKKNANLYESATLGASIASTGGVLEFTLPEGYESMSGLSIKGEGSVLVSAVALVFEKEEQEVVEGQPVFASIENADSRYTEFYLAKELVVKGECMNAVEKFVVDGIDAPVVGTATASEAHFVVPSTISGTAEKTVSLQAIYNGGEVAFTHSIAVRPFYFTKGLKIRTGSNSKSTYPAENAAEAFLLLNEGRVISTSEWAAVDTYAAAGTNAVITAVAKADANATAEQYYSVQPYIFLTASSAHKLAFQNPANSATQLKCFWADGVQLPATFGTPSIYMRPNVDNATFKQSVLDGTMTDIVAYTKTAGSAAPALGTGTSDWNEGSVIEIQYVKFEYVQSTGGKPAAATDVFRQGFMVIRDVTCNDGVLASETREGYVEFDLYWSNEIN